MDEILLSDKEKHKHIEGFAKAHRKAALRYCKKHGIDPAGIHAYTEESSLSIVYEFKGKTFLTATLSYIPKVNLKFKQIKTNENT